MFLEFWEALEDAKDGGCYGQVAESGKLGKKKVRCNLVGAKHVHYKTGDNVKYRSKLSIKPLMFFFKQVF